MTIGSTQPTSPTLYKYHNSQWRLKTSRDGAVKFLILGLSAEFCVYSHAPWRHHTALSPKNLFYKRFWRSQTPEVSTSS